MDFGFFDPTVSSTDQALSSGQSSVQVFQNPARDEIRIKGELSQYQVEIFDTAGRLFSKIASADASESIDISTLPKGLFIIKVTDKVNHARAILKVVKQ